MHKAILTILLAAVGNCAVNNQAIAAENIKLQCDGKYSDFTQKIQDMPIRGAYIEIRKNSVKIMGVLAFSDNDGTVFRVTKNNEVGILFALPTNDNYYGHMNRLSGVLQLTKLKDENKSQVELHFEGNCSPMKPLF